jgi:hypothetical protein
MTQTGVVTFSGGLINFTTAATTTIANNTPHAWTIATSTTATPLFQIDTTSGSEMVSIGAGGSDVYPDLSTGTLIEPGAVRVGVPGVP